ncbi:unnamed protein product, partial [Adineta ricciae]
RHYLYGIYTGFQWQCVEYARRWLLLRKSSIFKDISSACDMWRGLTYIERVTDGTQFPLRPVPNGSPEPPVKDSILIYRRSLRMPFGHVAIITDVVSDHVHVAEQNHLHQYWAGDYARRVPIRFENGRYYIDDVDQVFGWMVIEDNGQLRPFEESMRDQILQQYIHRQPTGLFTRLFTSNRNQQS